MKRNEWIGDIFGPEGIEAFWQRVEIRKPDECWPWKKELYKRTSTLRYGSFMFNKARDNSHRIALELTLGRPVTGYALHSCDYPPCCNPAHLREGTPADNCRDAWLRGRQANNEWWNLGPARKLTDDQVIAICEARSLGVRTELVARTANVSPALVQRYFRRFKNGEDLRKTQNVKPSKSL